MAAYMYVRTYRPGIVLLGDDPGHIRNAPIYLVGNDPFRVTTLSKTGDGNKSHFPLLFMFMLFLIVEWSCAWSMQEKMDEDYSFSAGKTVNQYKSQNEISV
jgi:hypothetical protein